MEGNRLYKSEKLCSKLEIEKLYAQGTSIIAYPLRAVWIAVPAQEDKHTVAARFLISIPKKRIRHAVDRVLLRRRTREAYRLNREILRGITETSGKTALIGFNWLANENRDYATVERSMRDILVKISTAIANDSE